MVKPAYPRNYSTFNILDFFCPVLFFPYVGPRRIEYRYKLYFDKVEFLVLDMCILLLLALIKEKNMFHMFYVPRKWGPANGFLLVEGVAFNC